MDMATSLLARWELYAVCLLLQLGWPAATLASDVLNWRTNAALVTADVHDAKLQWLLEQINSATGWQVYVEPGVSRVVSAKFVNQPPGEALRLLLGNLSFALIPEATGSRKLFVFSTSLVKATQPVIMPMPSASRYRLPINRARSQRR